MMRRHTRHLLLFSSLHSARFGSALVALLAVSMACSAARAQFSGPALGADAPVNAPMTPTTDPAILYPQAHDLRLMHGDLITVHLYATNDYAPTVRIGLDGTVQLPLIGVVSVEGLTLAEAERLIAQRLEAAGMYRNPQVTITLMESPNQTITLTGEMHGVLPVVGSRRLYDVLSAGGGLPPTASHVITINRPGVPQPIVVDLGNNPATSAAANIPVFAGDTIVVPSTGFIYILGAFKNQIAVPIRQNTPLTLMQAAAIGGGPGYEAKLSDLRIIRTIGTERRVVHVDVKKVIDGKAPDPVLESDDIVFLPTSAMKAAIKSGGFGTLIGLASILVFAAKQ